MFLFVACGNSDKEIDQVIDQKEKPQEESENVTMILSDEGLPMYKLEAKKLIRFQEDSNSRMVCPEGMRVTFYDSLGVMESTLWANKGVYYGLKELIEVEDSVRFENVKEEMLETNFLHLDFKRDCCYTNDFAKVSNPKGYLAGYNMISDLKFKDYNIINITGQAFYPEALTSSPDEQQNP